MRSFRACLNVKLTYEEYDYVFGREASVAKSQQTHFACVKAIMGSLKSLTEKVLSS